VFHFLQHFPTHWRVRVRLIHQRIFRSTKLRSNNISTSFNSIRSNNENKQAIRLSIILLLKTTNVPFRSTLEHHQTRISDREGYGEYIWSKLSTCFFSNISMQMTHSSPPSIGMFEKNTRFDSAFNIKYCWMLVSSRLHLNNTIESLEKIFET
jgi:hypothetical protein